MNTNIEVLRELDELVEAARLLGVTQAKKGFGCYTDEDRRFERAMYESIYKHRAALLDWEAKQPAAGDGCHCATCTCNPNMTPAVRFDLSPAQQEGAIREHLIRLGWTPPDKHAQQPAEIEALRKDAARYRWLRDPCSGAEYVIFYCRGDYGKGLMTSTMLDAAIDEAIEKEEK